jgi:hypothetical protein
VGGCGIAGLQEHVMEWLKCLVLLVQLLAAVGSPPGGSSSVHSYTQTVHRTTQLTTEEHN